MIMAALPAVTTRCGLRRLAGRAMTPASVAWTLPGPAEATTQRHRPEW